MESSYKIISKIRNVYVHSSKLRKHFHKHKKKIEKIHRDSEKLINSFKMKKKGLPGYLLGNYYFLPIF